MGRASRLKHNPERERWRREQDVAPMRHGGGRYVSDQSHADLLRATAVHEAGHVVSAIALGLDVHYSILEVLRDTRQTAIGGYTELKFGALQDFDSKEAAIAAAVTPEMLRKRTIQVLAGSLAEGIVNRNERDVCSGAEGDEQRAVEFAFRATCRAKPADDNEVRRAAQTAMRYVEDCDREARALLMKHVDALNTVAKYLFEHQNEKVEGATLRTLVANERGEA